MHIYKSPLLISPDESSTEYLWITPQLAHWEYLNFSACRLGIGQQWGFDTTGHELALVVLGGICNVRSSCGDWENIGRRRNVFNGMPYTLYLPRQTRFTIEAVSQELDFACAWCPTDQEHPPKLVAPEHVDIEIRGGDNFTRQINRMIPPGFDCHRLVVVEVYTPSGSWSSYPGHKHDQHIVGADGELLEADLEEIYFYKIDKPHGYAYQRVYNDDKSLDELILVRDSHAVLIPEGYHPVVSPPGYTTYYLNFLAGSAQALTATDDPQYAWTKDFWKKRDPRIPIVSMAMEE
ncbi:MAG TPA: 5-deoxy-glucuronate isomerase [Anaerolineales bacterium]|nr:5-deoxy-glucuronate isomerase [Anaerolineales bacterium]